MFFMQALEFPYQKRDVDEKDLEFKHVFMGLKLVVICMLDERTRFFFDLN